jgi:hypothetical protein
MIKRQLSKRITELLKAFPAVAILGPRQVGKTTLSKSLALKTKKEVVYLDLERSSTYDILKKNAENYLLSYSEQLVIIDEIQRLPTLFPLLRSLIDENRVAARFIITGSASPELLKGASESLAGRIFYSYLNPIGLHEIPANITQQQHWIKGGFPQALIIKDNQLRREWMEAFITNYIERDLPFLFDYKFSTSTMKKLWSMLAHLQSKLLNAEDIGRSLDITGTTLKRYLDYLEASFIITRLPPFYVNIGKRLVKSPKLYINDSGILHFLLNINNNNDLLNHPSLGASWEGYAITQIKYAKPDRLDLYFYRTQVGAECDLVLCKGHQIVACVEIKYSNSPNLSRGFYQSMEDLNTKVGFVIIPELVDYETHNDIKIVGLSTFIKKHLRNLL